jgi:hypothetical protein
MSTLKRKNANGVWEYIQVTGQDVSQLQSDIDSVTTSLADMTQKRFKGVKVDVVADFGADPTGATNSDVAVSNAITAIVNSINVLTSPAILWFPTGSYQFSQPFPTITNKISIQGNGINGTILNFNHTTGANCITFGNDSASMSYIHCFGFTVKGNSQTGHGLYLNYVTGSRFEHIATQSCGGDGIHYEKGWEVRFLNIKGTDNTGNGIFISGKKEAFSEVNDVNIRESFFGGNGKIGIVIGDEADTYTAEEGYNVVISSSYSGQNGLGNILVAGERNVVIEGNYMEDAGKSVPNGTDAFHIYIGKRSAGGIGTAHAITIRDNHFNAMNDSHITPPINNASGYAIIIDNAIGVTVENNFFYQSVTGSILVKSTAQKVFVKPNIYYENTGIPYVVDQTNNQVAWLAQSGNQLQLTGLLTGNYFQQQGFENLIKNGNFDLVDASNNPQGFSTQSFTFAKDTDGALICTGTSGGGFQKVQFDVGTRYSQFKGKYVIFCAEVKVVSGTTSNLNLRILDGVSETDLPITADGIYRDLYVVRKIDANATYLRFSISSANGTGATTDQVYIRNMRAYYGQTPLGYQKAPTDHAPDIVTTLPTASANYRGRTVMVQGNGTTTADIIYICLMSATGTYSWKQVITG